MITMRSLALLLTMTLACNADLPEMTDNSLENPTLTGADADVELTGALSATPGEEDGDWSLVIGSMTLAYHSPSRVDLSPLSGEATLLITSNWDAPPSLTIEDSAGVAFSSSSSLRDDSLAAFGRQVWEVGDEIGQGFVLDEEGGETAVVFVDVKVTDDLGSVNVLPGEPTRIVLDGVAYRFTGIAAYVEDPPNKLECPVPDMLTVELIRIDAPDLDRLAPPTDRRAIPGTCP